MGLSLSLDRPDPVSFCTTQSCFLRISPEPFEAEDDEENCLIAASSTAVMDAVLPCTASSSTFKLTFSPSKSFVFTLPAIRPLRLRYYNHPRLSLSRVTATLSAVESPSKSSSDGQNEKNRPLLQVTDLTAVIAETKQEILKGVNLSVNEGEVILNFNLHL